MTRGRRSSGKKALSFPASRVVFSSSVFWKHVHFSHDERVSPQRCLISPSTARAAATLSGFCECVPAMPVRFALGMLSSSNCQVPPSTRSMYFAEPARSEEHTSELQSLAYLVCRLLLEKK